MSEQLPGSSLREAREAKGLSMSDVASSTHIKVQIIEDLEENDFSRIAAPIYGKGFIKLYAEFLGLEPQPLLDAYLKRMASGGSSPRRSRKPRPASGPSNASQASGTGAGAENKPSAPATGNGADVAAYPIDPGPKELPLDFGEDTPEESSEEGQLQKSDPHEFANQLAEVTSPAVTEDYDEPDFDILDDIALDEFSDEDFSVSQAQVEEPAPVAEEEPPIEKVVEEKEDAPAEEPEPAPPPKTPSELAAEHKRNYLTVVVSVLIIICVVIIGINNVVKERQAQSDSEANRPDAPLKVSEDPPDPYLD